MWLKSVLVIASFVCVYKHLLLFSIHCESCPMNIFYVFVKIIKICVAFIGI
jgi:hypothetical protein